MFDRFVDGMSTDDRVGGRLLVAAPADRGTAVLLARLGNWDGRIVEYGPGDRCECAPTSPSTPPEPPSRCSAADSARRSRAPTTCSMPWVRSRWVRSSGIGLEALQDGLEGFSGAARRLELIADTAGVLVFDDYAHHPTEVRAALAGAAAAGGRPPPVGRDRAPHVCADPRDVRRLRRSLPRSR